MYVAITPTVAISYKYGYRINGRSEGLTVGGYGWLPRRGALLGSLPTVKLKIRRAIRIGFDIFDRPRAWRLAPGRVTSLCHENLDADETIIRDSAEHRAE